MGDFIPQTPSLGPCPQTPSSLRAYRSFLSENSMKRGLARRIRRSRKPLAQYKKFRPSSPELHVLKWRRHPDSNWRMKLLQSFALPLGYGAIWSGRRDSDSRHPPWQGGTLPLSYYRIWCLGAESNHRHGDFQSPALPTELPRQKWRRGRGSNPRPPA